MRSEDLLRRAAERASDQPFFLASSLLAYARAERLDDAGLAAEVGCDPGQLAGLLLCRRPTGGGTVFRRDVETIAQRFGLEAGRLAQLIRKADALVAFRQPAAGEAGQLLAAARDRLDADSPSVPEAGLSEPPAGPPGPAAEEPDA